MINIDYFNKFKVNHVILIWLYEILILLDQNQQELLIKQLNIYDKLSDTPAMRIFVLKTAKLLTTEDQIVFYLNRILDKSLSDYVHMLCTIISSRHEHHRSILKLTACLKALFLYIQETEFEEINETEQIRKFLIYQI